jgi:hypothetical protein
MRLRALTFRSLGSISSGGISISPDSRSIWEIMFWNIVLRIQDRFRR